MKPNHFQVKDRHSVRPAGRLRGELPALPEGGRRLGGSLLQVAVRFKFTFEAKVLRIHLWLDVLESKGFKRSRGPCPRVSGEDWC